MHYGRVVLADRQPDSLSPEAETQQNNGKHEGHGAANSVRAELCVIKKGKIPCGAVCSLFS